MEPPIQTEYLRSGGATTLTFMLLGARAVISLFMRSAMPGNMVVPVLAACKHKRENRIPDVRRTTQAACTGAQAKYEDDEAAVVLS